MEIEFGVAQGSGVAGKTAVSTVNPLPVGGAADNSVINTNTGVLVGGKMDATAGGLAVGATGRFGTLLLDLARRIITKPLGAGINHVTGKNSQTAATTPTSLIAAQGATVRVDLQSVVYANRDNVAHTFDLMDSATVVESIIVAAGDSRVVSYPGGRVQAALNTSWQFQIRELATTAVEVSVSGYKTTA